MSNKQKSTWLYAPVGWLLALLARMPFCVLYAVSDILFVIVYHILRYRRKVVTDNIISSFPSVSANEQRKMVRSFFRNFTDYFVETIKLGHISDEQMMRRMEFENIEELQRLVDQGRSVVCYFSHCGNWEWGTSITLWGPPPSDSLVYAQVYRPLANSWFDAYFLRLRSRFHSESFAKRTVLRDLITLRRQGRQVVCGFMSDQKPSHGDTPDIVMFLNHPTAMITGTETLARKLDMSVLYMDMYKTSRGHYKIALRLIAEDPNAVPPMAITERYAQMLQQTIRRNPPIWLWSHKRWKYPVTMPENKPTLQ